MKLVVTDILDFDLNVEGEHKLVVVRDDIKQCVGCFGCWVKTPGKCVICDGYENNSADMGRCDEYIIVSKCCYGSFSPNIKKLLDRSIGYVHPDFELRGGEMHHKRRYDNVINLTAYFYGENITEEDKETCKELVSANADNFDGKVRAVRFLAKAEDLKGEVL